jgi:hypothetical protein
MRHLVRRNLKAGYFSSPHLRGQYSDVPARRSAPASVRPATLAVLAIIALSATAHADRMRTTADAGTPASPPSATPALDASVALPVQSASATAPVTSASRAGALNVVVAA